MSKWSNDAVPADVAGAFDHGERPNDGVATDRGAGVDIGGAWIDDGDSVEHQLVLDSLLHQFVRLGKLSAVVDAERVDLVSEDFRSYRSTLISKDRGNVGQVVFALGVVGADFLQ